MKTILLTGLILMMFLLTSAIPEQNSRSLSFAPSDLENPAVIHLTEATFRQMVFDYEKNKEWKYAGTTPAIIDFYADWCGPCRQLSPIVEEVAREYSGKIIVYKVDTEKERKLSQSIGISALPTLVFIPVKGKPQVSMGALSKSALIKAINDVLLVR